MPSLRALLILFALARAQQCYYPDGSPSTDIPCSNGAASSCCGETSFCMDNGLCFGGGILSRGSCTDKSWSSQACTEYCTTELSSSSVPLTPCSTNGGSNTFVCGLNATACSTSSAVFSLSGTGTIVLRTSQVESLVGSAFSTITTCPTSTPTTLPPGAFSSTAMAGLGLGLGLPLLISLFAAIYFYLRERRNAPPKLMYKLPDDHDEFLFNVPAKLNAGRNPSLRIHPPSDAASIISSAHSAASTPPAHMQSFAERYKILAEKNGVAVRAAELPGSPMAHELGERRKSEREQKR